MAVYVFPPVNANVTITGGATEATLLDIETQVTGINAKDIATSAKQDSQITLATSANTKLDTVIAKDFSTSAKQDLQTTALNSIDTSLNNIESDIDALNLRTAGALVPSAFDYIATAYVGATTDISTVTYKTGGAAGTTVATLTMGYDGSNRLISVTKS